MTGNRLSPARLWRLCAGSLVTKAWPRHWLALGAYVAVTLGFTWPLPINLAARLTGSPTGDTGVYVWNLWVFQHELLDLGRFPFFTSAIFSLGSRVDLALHNYTPFAGVVGLPLVPIFGVVTSFNLIYLALIISTAYAMYLLARDVAGDGLGAWLAGLLLAFSPALVARGTAHFSLVAAAPLPLFVLLLRMAGRSGRPGHMVALGATMAWATYCDPYYGVYCLVLGLWHMAASAVSISVEDRTPPAPPWARIVVTCWMGLSIVTTLAIAATGGGELTAGPLRIGLRTLYTPMLSLTAAAAAYYLVHHRLAFSWRPSAGFRTLWRLAPYGAFSAVVLLSPLLVTTVMRALDGRYVSPHVLWRTSTPGVDLLSFILPNPNHPLVRDWVSGWLAARDGGFVENVASIPIVALLAIGFAGAARWLRSSAYWVGLAVMTASFALGPFLNVAGFNLFVPTPWAIVRFLPVVGEARAPARFTVLVMVAVAVLFALAFQAISRHVPRWKGTLALVFTVALLAELIPAPRPLYSAVMPPVYDVIRADARDVRVLELPFGVRDGLSSYGNFSASTQFHQTWHGKRLIGGYLSRVSSRRVESVRQFPVLNALMLLSEGAPLPPGLEDAAMARAERFIREARVGYVVVRKLRASPELVDFAVRTLDLEVVMTTETRVLYRPRQSTSQAWLTASDVPPPAQRP